MTDQIEPQSKLPPKKAPILTRYVMGWAGLAGVSLLYLGAVSLEPSLLGAAPNASTTSPEKVALESALSQIRELKGQLTRVNTRLATIRDETSARDARDLDVMERLAALEGPADPSVKPTAKKQTASKKTPPKTSPVKTAALPKKSKPKPAPKKVSKPRVVTGAVPKKPAAKAPITFGPAIVTRTKASPAPSATKKSYGIMIATGPSVDSLRLSWTLLSERHGTRLSALRPRYNRAGGAGAPLSLVAGPVKSMAGAKRLCNELLARGTACAPATYSGDAL